MGQKIVLSGVTFTDGTLPKLRDDPLLSVGSLFLFDPGHSLGSFTGVPGVAANNIPNVAWKEAAALLGSGTQTSLAGSVATRDADDSIWKVERSTKGGVHGIITQAGSQAANRAWVVDLPAAIRDYIRTNTPGKTFYVSIWRKITRAPLASSAVQSPMHCAANTTNFLFHMQSGVFNGAGGSTDNSSGSSQDSALVAPIDRFAAGSIAAVSGTGVGGTTPVRFGLGTFDAWASLNFNKGPSHVIYRAYVEDLTASGRSFATVAALDRALWTAAFAAGGKFNGDTYTSPSTIA